MLLALNLLSSGLKAATSTPSKALNVQQRQLQHFTTETAACRPRSSSTWRCPTRPWCGRSTGPLSCCSPSSTPPTRPARLRRRVGVGCASRCRALAGYQELGRINLEIDRIYHRELRVGQQSARPASLMLSSSAESRAARPDRPGVPLADRRLRGCAAEDERLLRPAGGQRASPRAPPWSGWRSLALIEQLTHDAFERTVLQRAGRAHPPHDLRPGQPAAGPARRGAVMERQIEASQHEIARVASSWTTRHASIEADLRARYTARLARSTRCR